MVEKEAVKTLAREQEEDLRKFKAEVLSKQARDRDRTAQLRIDRSVQLEEKTARVREEERQRKREVSAQRPPPPTLAREPNAFLSVSAATVIVKISPRSVNHVL